MPAPLKFIQYHWAQRKSPGSRFIGYVGKALVECGAFFLVSTVLVLAFHAYDTESFLGFSFGKFERAISYATIFTVTFGYQFKESFCSIILDEEPENYR